MASRFPGYAGLLSKAAPLLLLAALAALPSPAPAESADGEGLSLILSQSPDAPVVGRSFILTLLVSHPNPAEVRVDAPPFPPALSLDRVKSAPRSVPGMPGESERWTAVEYAFTVKAPGPFVIGPFEVSAAGRRAETGTVSAAAALPPGPADPPSLEWVVEAAERRALEAGSAAELRLHLSGAAAAPDLRPDTDVPEDSIFEALPLDPPMRAAGIVGSFRLTPLRKGPLRLPAASLELPDGRILRARPLSFEISSGASGSKSVSGTGGKAASSVKSLSRGPVADFPSAPMYPPVLSVSIARDLDAARRAWETGDYVSALATLRAAERDRVAGPVVRGVRIGAERVLALGPSEDEPYAPRAALLALALSFLAAALGSAFALLLDALRGKRVTSRRRRRLAFMAAALISAALCASWLFYARTRASGHVVLGRCFSLRVPDPGSARSASFSEGQSARVSARAVSGGAEWLYIETTDGRSGWIDASRARGY